MEAAARLKDADPKGTKILVMSMGPEAVSYTHLDVYKRQTSGYA